MSTGEDAAMAAMEEYLVDAARAAEVLAAGNPLVFPTDTVYGVGVAVHAAPGPSILSELKGRDHGKPIAWLVAAHADLDRYGANVPAYARALARVFWPGALTLVVRAGDRVPEAFRSQAGTVGLRMPGSDAALALALALGSPLAATSANFAGAPAPGSLAELDPAFAARVGHVLAGVVPASGIASTVVDCTGTAPRVLREGSISENAVAAAAGRVPADA